MNYFIQGDAANAERIKAAFQKLGIDTLDFSFGSKHRFYFTVEGKISFFYTNNELRDVIKTHPDYKELELPVEPKFKVGDWVVTNYGKVSQVVSVDKDGDGYTLDDGVYFSGSWCDMYHLWSIADAKDGDILSAKIDGDDYILIFKQIKDGWIETYGHYYITIDKFCAPTQMFCRNYQGRLYPATQEQYRTLFKKMHDDGYEWYADKKELKKIPVKPKFKVGDWITDGISKCQIHFIDNTQYWYSENCILGSIESVNKRYRLWEISDARDGDVLYFNDNTIVVFKDLYNSTTFHSYCHIEDDIFDISKGGMPDWWESKDFKPATKEQRDLLFDKMKEAGYEWDADKKELRKIKSRYDIANFYTGMPVLVRDKDNRKWCYLLYSHYDNTYEDGLCFNAGSVEWRQCIPYNEETMHLLGTTDMPSEEYINW